MNRSLPELIAAARAGSDFNAVIQAVPYFRFLGLSARIENGVLILVLPGLEQHVGRPDPPFIHGGIIGALLESAALIQLMATDTVSVAKTISITTDFLRSARVAEIFACASITRQGRRVANVRIEAWQDERARPIALAHGHFLLT